MLALAAKKGSSLMVLGGAVLVAAAWTLNSVADSLPLLYVGALLGGVGTGCVYGTCVGNALKWFHDRRGLAAGITAAGFGAGAAATVIPISNMIKSAGYQQAFLFFGLLQGAANLAFMWLAASGKSTLLMAFAVLAENVTSGMGTAAFVALLMALCDARFSATQYALLSAFAAFGRVYVGPASGYVQSATGWVVYFFIAFLMAWPGLLLVWRMRRTIERLEPARAARA